MIAPLLAFALIPPPGPPAPGDEPAPEVSAERIAATIERLAEFPTRHTLSDDYPRAADWAAERLREAAIGPVSSRSFAIGGRSRRNIVCTKRGSTRPDEHVLVVAHLDSRGRRLGDADGPAPGADDNASGIAALLEIARALRGVETDRSVVLAAFGGEEQGLVGSRAFAEAAEAEGMEIVLVLNLDMIGHPMDPAGRSIVVERDPGLRRPENDEASRRWADRLARLVEDAGLDPEPGPMYGSDYIPFEAAGFPCVGLFDGADRAPFYHSADDTPAVVDSSYCAAAARAALRLALEAAAVDPGDR